MTAHRTPLRTRVFVDSLLIWVALVGTVSLFCFGAGIAVGSAATLASLPDPPPGEGQLRLELAMCIQANDRAKEALDSIHQMLHDMVPEGSPALVTRTDEP